MCFPEVGSARHAGWRSGGGSGGVAAAGRRGGGGGGVARRGARHGRDRPLAQPQDAGACAGVRARGDAAARRAAAAAASLDPSAERAVSGQETAKPKTKVHNAAKLAEALGLGGGRWAKARWAGLVPDPDRAAGTWSGPLVDELLARAEAIRAAIPDVLTLGELENALGLDFGERRRAEQAGVLPAPDRGEFFSRQAADALVAQVEAVRARIPAQPLGAGRCAGLLAELTGLAVVGEDVVALAEAGYTAVVDEYKGFDLFNVDRLKALPDDSEALAVLTGLVAERQAWIESSITPEDAAVWLRWDRRDLTRIAAERGIATGRGGRYARTDIAVLAGDED